MKFTLKNPTRYSLNSLMRKIGYHFNGKDKNSKELNFIRPIRGRSYPRFHVYIEKKKEKLLFKLHLDQKRPSYGNETAHSGEYEGKKVKEEVTRIKNRISNLKDE